MCLNQLTGRYSVGCRPAAGIMHHDHDRHPSSSANIIKFTFTLVGLRAFIPVARKLACLE
jgi:hypothetical protein